MFLTQEMCDKAIVENAGTLNFVLNYYKKQIFVAFYNKIAVAFCNKVS